MLISIFLWHCNSWRYSMGLRSLGTKGNGNLAYGICGSYTIRWHTRCTLPANVKTAILPFLCRLSC